MPTQPGALYLDNKVFSQFQWNLELEERHEILGQPGKLKLTGFLSRGRIGLYEDAIAAAQLTDTTPDANSVLRYRSRAGISLNLEQQLTKDLGLFLRAGVADGRSQIVAFTDIDQTVSGGLSLTGTGWGRSQDTVGIGVVRNGISSHFKNYLNAGGLGMLIGDGQLPHPGAETIVETYYRLAMFHYAHLTADYQYIDNPAYNRDRGPVSVLALRLHAQF